MARKKTKNKNTFTQLSKKVAKQYEGKKVAPEYQDEYGKKYNKEEAKEVGNKVAATALIHDKKESGGDVDSEYYIYEGTENRTGKPLYHVTSKVNEYVGEWHTKKEDAQKELDGLLDKKHKQGGEVTVLELKFIKNADVLRVVGDTEEKDFFKKGEGVYGNKIKEVGDMYCIVDYRGDETIRYFVPKDSAEIVGKEQMKHGGELKSCGCYKPVRPTLQYKYGGAIDSPKIFVESLSDYNDGRSVGKWLDLTNYTDGETVMEAIQEFLEDVRDEHGGEEREEWAIHDYENFPSMYYHESMGEKDFDRVYEFVEMSKTIPADAIEGYVNYGHDLSEIEEAYIGQYKDAEDLAYNIVEEFGGIDEIENKHFYLFVSDIDRRLVAGEEADNYVSDIKDEDDGERLIDEAGLDVEKYREASENEREEMLAKADEIVREKIEEEWEEGLKDPYGFLVEEQGIYSGDDILKSNFVQFDYEKFGEDLLINDYFGVEKGHDTMYVFRRM